MENLGRKILSRISNFCEENLGWKMLSRISNLGGGKFEVEKAISKLVFGGGGGWKIWGGKCYLESPIFWVENLGRKMLSRISNLGGGKFGVENAISNLEFGGWKIWGGKCYLESPIFGVEKFGVESAISNLEFGGGGVENLGWKMISRNF